MNEHKKQSEAKAKSKSNHRRRIHWAFPLGIAAAGLGAVATVLLRGCWHRNMSWPIRHEHTDYSYQVCTDCGVKRLFDEKHFRPYGPYGQDVRELIAEVERRREERVERARGRDNAATDTPSQQ
jgi:DNA-directed RNA polymerase subunit RPC12/RpoP